MSLKLRTQRIKSQVFEDKNGIAITQFSADDTMAANSDVQLPTQGSVKAYVDTAVAGGISSSENVVAFPMSFETGEQGALKIYFPMKVTINKIRTTVLKALSDTNTGTITGANSSGASTGGVVTIAASAALNEEDSAVPTTNNVVLADSYYQLTSAKTKVAGKVLVSLEYTITA